MKKTVSWSVEAIQRDADSNTQNDEVSCNNLTTTASSPSLAPISNRQVNLRIQQMISMQKAQNATMRQLMSTGHGGGTSSASPSGLRDLVKIPCLSSQGGEKMIGNDGQLSGMISVSNPPTTVTSYCDLGGAPKTDPMQQPPTRSNLSTHDQLSSHEAAGIHFQAPQSINTLLPGNQMSPDLTPPHLHPAMPNYAGQDGNDSPVSYNSVLDQNFGAQKQNHKQANQSQPQSVEMHDGTGVGHQSKQLSLLAERYPISHQEGTNTTAIRDHTTNLLEHQSGHNPNAVLSSCGAPPNTTHTPLDTQHVIQIQQNVVPETLFSGAHDRDVGAISPLSTHHTHHKFHYGSIAHDSGTPHSVNSHDQTAGKKDLQFNTSLRVLQSRMHRRRRNLFLTILCYPFRQLLPSEQNCRSLCFGAIDGMLTGAGILSACVGLGLVSQVVPSDEEFASMRWIPFALTLAATFSDGICMAIGHVWSTHLVAATAYEERKEELRNFETCRADAKARLVDTLLLQGMLKIDAMCLADTLEGYPDLFVSALLGGGICTDDNNAEPMIGYTGLGDGDGCGMVQAPGQIAPTRQTNMQEPIGNAFDTSSLPYVPGVTGHHGFNHESHCDSRNFYDDPDLKALSETVSASSLESFFMTLSFISFSVVPSLIYTLLPTILNSVMADGDALVTQLSLCLTASVMFLLGVWKSHFYSCNWFLFGLKSAGVLAVCIATAYSLGFVCSIAIGHSKPASPVRQ